MAENLSTGDQALILLINTIATFFALYFLITAFNSFSNHFNPIVSFVIYLDQKISLTTLMIFIFLQISGAIAGVLAANYMFGIENFEFSQKDRSGLNIFVAEAIASFGLVFFILISKKEKIAIVVATYIGSAYWFTSSTSFANPAGTVGRMFSDTFAGISPENVMFFCIVRHNKCCVPWT